MAGTYFADASVTDLLASCDLSTDATDTGDAVQVNWPQLVLWLLDTGTVAGTNSIDIQGSESSSFDDDVVTYVTIPVGASDDDAELEGNIFVTSKYVRAVVTIGTSGDMAGSTLKLYPPHYKRTKTNSAKALV